MQLQRARKSRSIRKIAIASSVAVMVAWGASARATTYTWVGGTSGDANNFNDAANWTPSGGPPGNTSPNDVAYFNTSQSNQPQLTISDTIGELDFNNSGWMLSSSSTSNTLTLNGTGGIGVLSAAASGTNEISANLNIGATQTWEVATGGTLQIDGVLSNTNSAGLTIGASGYGGTVLLTNANPNFTGGGLIVNTGTLELGGATVNSTQQFGTLTGATAITIDSGGTFEINNTTAAGGNASNRLNSPVMVFNGGKFVYVGSGVAGTASAETLGAVDLNTGPISTITVTLPSSNSTGSAVVNLGTISQYTPNGTSQFLPVAIYSGSMLINGTNLGLTGGGTVLTNNTAALNLQGASSPAAGAESVGTYNLQIAPFLLGESGIGSGQGGTASGTPNTFLTYNSTTGFRPLNPTDEFASTINDGSTGGTVTTGYYGDNIYITTSQSAVLSGNNSINSLVINGSGSPTLTIPSGISLTDSSGALLFVTSGTIAGGPLDFGQSNSANGDVNITVNPGQTATINSNVTGTGTSMNVTGGGSLVFGGSATFNNGIAANNATVTFTNGWNPAGSNIFLMNAYAGSTFNFDGSSTIPVSGDSPSMQMYLFNSTVNVNGTLTFTNGTSVYQQWNLGNSTLNIGSASVTESAALNANGASGVIFAADLGNGTVNVFSGGTLSVPNGTAEIAKNAVGNVVVNVENGGTATFKAVVLGDNGGSTATQGILAAIYLQSGANLDITTTTSGTGVFSIGASGTGTPSGGVGGGGENNDYGYVSVPTGATIGNGTANTPGEIDIAGAFRGSPVGGGNGVMDVAGGTVNVGSAIAMANSTIDQQFAALNITAGGSVTLNNGSMTMSGSTTEASAGIYGSYSNVNVVGSTLALTTANHSINLAGSSAGGATGTAPYAVQLLPTGILSITGSSTVKVGYIRAGTISASVGGTTYDGSASAYVNLNGGTLTNTGGSSVFLYQSGQYYVYNSGITLTGTGDTISALDAPTGEGIPTGTIGGASVKGGSGYVAPPVVVISDPTGFDASGYATINSSGQVTGVVITNPGFNMSDPTIQFVGGGGTGASVTLPALVSNTSGGITIGTGTTGSFTLTGAFGGPDPNSATVGAYSFTNSNGSDNYNITGTSNTLGIATAGSGLGNDPYASGTYYGTSYPGIRNNTSTYTGPTVIQAGSLALKDTTSAATSGNPNNYAVNAFAAVNNNIPFSSDIAVGDVTGNSAAVLNITGVAGSGGFQLAPGLINSVSYNGGTYTQMTNPQALSGFGTVTGSSTVGLTVGLASGGVTATSSGTSSTGNNFGGYAYANSGTWTSAPSSNNSIIAPGYTTLTSAPAYTGTPSGYNSNAPYYGAIVAGAGTGSSGTPAGTQGFAFNTQNGGASADLAGSSPQPTGRLTLSQGSGVTSSNAMTTTLGAGGIYYWKLNLGTAGAAGATSTPGTETSTGASTSGTAWDALVMDAVTAGTASNSTPFTVEAYGFNLGSEQSSPVTIGNGSAQSYSWAVARVTYVNNGSGLVAATSTTLAPLLADLSLNTNGLPQAASGYEYFLNAQNDPLGGADLVVNYAPVPEPTALSLLGMGAAALMIRRRRKVGRPSN